MYLSVVTVRMAQLVIRNTMLVLNVAPNVMEAICNHGPVDIRVHNAMKK